MTAVACADDAEVLRVLASAFGHLMTWTTWTRCVYPSQIRSRATHGRAGSPCTSSTAGLRRLRRVGTHVEGAVPTIACVLASRASHAASLRLPSDESLPSSSVLGPSLGATHLPHFELAPPYGRAEHGTVLQTGLARGRPTLRHRPTAPMLLAPWCLASEPRARPRHSHRRQCRCLVHPLAGGRSPT